MAFTDLAEHLEEVFGEIRTEDQHTASVQSQRGSRGFRSAKEKRRVEHQRRIRRAMERFMLEIASGVRPSTCCGPYCHHLLKPQRGAVRRFCSKYCERLKRKMVVQTGA